MAQALGGPLAPRPTANIKGQLFEARLAWLREKHGADAVERVLDALPEEDRAVLRGVSREAWYPFGVLIRLDGVIASVLEPDNAAIYEELGMASARHRTEWLGDHARLVSVHGFLSRAAEDHRRFHDFGTAVYRRVGFYGGELEYSGYPESYVVFCRSSRGYFQRAVELLTKAEVTVEESTCQAQGGESCLFRIRWGTRA